MSARSCCQGRGCKAKKDAFDRKPEVKEQLSYLIDQFIGQEYLRKVVIANVSVPEEELKKYYQEHEKDFAVPERVKASHIYVAAAKDATSEVKAKAKAKAEKIRKLLKKGEDFAKLAKENSEDTDSAAKGGDLGYLTPGKTNSEEFEKVVFSLKAGEVSPVVETPLVTTSSKSLSVRKSGRLPLMKQGNISLRI